MRALASAVMRGRSQAVMMATVFAMVSLLFPPASVLSSAVVALVTLRNGPAAGGLVLVLASAACGLLAQLLFGGAVPVIGFTLLMWLPVWMLALVLRFSRSLEWSLVASLLLGVVVIAGQYAQVDNPVEQWRSLLEPFTQSLVDAQLVDLARKGELIETLAVWMPGVLAAGFVLQSLGSLLLGRWWQALLYNPGGFRQEFHRLRLPKVLGVVSLIVLLVSALGADTDSMLLMYLGLLLLSAWFMQGLALIHGMVGLLKMNSGWLLGMYILLVFALPHMLTLIAAAGFADTWFDFRARLERRQGAGGAS
jgi:hypothetical protein